MIRGNADIVAIVILIGVAMFCSGARQILVSDLGGSKQIVLNRRGDVLRQTSLWSLCGEKRRSAVMVVAPLPPVAPLPFSR